MSDIPRPEETEIVDHKTAPLQPVSVKPEPKIHFEDPEGGRTAYQRRLLQSIEKNDGRHAED